MCSVVDFEASSRVSVPSFWSPHYSGLFRRSVGFADRRATPVQTQGIAGIAGADAVVQTLSMAVGQARSVGYGQQ